MERIKTVKDEATSYFKYCSHELSPFQELFKDLENFNSTKDKKEKRNSHQLSKTIPSNNLKEWGIERENINLNKLNNADISSTMPHFDRKKISNSKIMFSYNNYQLGNQFD